MLQQTEKGLRFSVKVTPKSKEEKVVKWENETLYVRLHAPPEKGEANRSLVRLLSRYFDVSLHQVILLSGETSRLKTILLESYPLEKFLLHLPKV